MALTYDDGPHPIHTRAILRELAQRDVRATFFVLTDRAEAHPEMVRSMLADGHEIALHGIDHARLTEVFWARTVARIWRAKRRLERVSGHRVTMYRPTYGAQGVAQFLTARLLGMDVVYWTAWAQDWLDDDARTVADRAVQARHPGAVLLLHDTTEDGEAMREGPLPSFDRGEVTARVADGLLADGYDLMPVGELIGRYPTVRSITTQRPWTAWRRHAERLRTHAAPPAE